MGRPWPPLEPQAALHLPCAPLLPRVVPTRPLPKNKTQPETLGQLTPTLHAHRPLWPPGPSCPTSAHPPPLLLRAVCDPPRGLCTCHSAAWAIPAPRPPSPLLPTRSPWAGGSLTPPAPGPAARSGQRLTRGGSGLPGGPGAQHRAQGGLHSEAAQPHPPGHPQAQLGSRGGGRARFAACHCTTHGRFISAPGACRLIRLPEAEATPTVCPRQGPAGAQVGNRASLEV